MKLNMEGKHCRMSASNFPTLTGDILRSYSVAALSNADDLLVEASLLRDNGHMARAYFLAVACIEEAGKALHAFDSQNRNLSDPTVRTRVKADLENHSKKIIYALGTWALKGSDLDRDMKSALKIISQLKHGREPSMYSDLRSDPDRAQTPREIVRGKAADDCIRLAENCLAHAHRHLNEMTPAKFTAAQDRLYVMKSAKVNEILGQEDFWWFYISRLESHDRPVDIAEAVLRYEQDHTKTGILFRSTE